MSSSSRVKCLIFHPFLRHFSWTWGEWNNCHLFSLFLSVVASRRRLFIFLAFAVSRENGDSSIFSGGRIYFSGNLLVDFMMKFVFTLLLTLDRKFQGCRKSIRNWCEKRNETGITQRNTKHTFKSQNADVELLAKRSNNQTCAVLFLISIIKKKKKKKEKFSFLAHSWPPYLE